MLFDQPLLFWHVFKFFPNQQILIYRQVCKTWKERIESLLEKIGFNENWVYTNLSEFIKTNNIYHKIQTCDLTTAKKTTFDTHDISFGTIHYCGKNWFLLSTFAIWKLCSYKNNVFKIWKEFHVKVRQVDVYGDDYIIVKLMIHDVLIYKIGTDRLEYITSIDFKEKLLKTYLKSDIIGFSTETNNFIVSVNVLNQKGFDSTKMQKFGPNDLIWPSHKNGFAIYYKEMSFASLAIIDSNDYQPIKILETHKFQLNRNNVYSITLPFFSYLFGGDPFFLYDPFTKELREFPEYLFIDSTQCDGTILCHHIQKQKNVVLKLDFLVQFGFFELFDYKHLVGNGDILKKEGFVFIGDSYACTNGNKLDILSFE